MCTLARLNCSTIATGWSCTKELRNCHFSIAVKLRSRNIAKPRSPCLLARGTCRSTNAPNRKKHIYVPSRMASDGALILFATNSSQQETLKCELAAGSNCPASADVAKMALYDIRMTLFDIKRCSRPKLDGYGGSGFSTTPAVLVTLSALCVALLPTRRTLLLDFN
ncbi:hypothetical protein IscW_ISCW010985 [Ixodes scapularis]|uniref:Uncharacterized protein n=1 Tax=Ixodes scapularis TaxID=6945 RepID=B7Q637_IXOSC|nr:hypothetical protein IscW_ISCW010985 [Ixodes scapularis]|eukprot:XP_002402634.1 hypothetical protein IscW_ISCW010985 [Ixodes scapularis]